MEELSADQLNGLLTSGENRHVEYKEYAALENSDDVLQQLTAFANRAGGDLLYGVRDDAEIEGTAIEPERVVERVSNLAKDRTSPLVEFFPRFYHGSAGDVLAFRVLKRRGVPCAVVKRKYHEIESRRYYIRTHHGVRMVDDRTLEWLFLHQEDPAVEEHFRFCVQYRRQDISLSPWIDSPF